MITRRLIPIISICTILGSAFAAPLKVVIISPSNGSPVTNFFDDDGNFDFDIFGYFTGVLTDPEDREWYTNDEFPRVNYDIEGVKTHLLGFLNESIDHQGSSVTVLKSFKSLNQLHHATALSLSGYEDRNTLQGNQYDVAVLINDPSMLTIIPTFAFEGVSNLSSDLLGEGTDVYLFEPNHETFEVSAKEVTHRIANGCGIDVIPAGEVIRQNPSSFSDPFSSEASYVTSATIFSSITGLGASSESTYLPADVGLTQAEVGVLEGDILNTISAEKTAEHYATSFNGQGKVIHRPLDLTLPPFNDTFAFTRTGTSTENQIQLSIRSLVDDHYLAKGEFPIDAQHTFVSAADKALTANFLPFAEAVENNFLLAFGRGQSDDIGVYEKDAQGNAVSDVNLSNMLALPYSRHSGASQGAAKNFDDSLEDMYLVTAAATARAYDHNGHRIPTYSIYARFREFYPDSTFIFDGVHQVNETIDATASAYVASAAGIDFDDDELNRRLYYRENDPYYIGWNTVMQQAFLSEDRKYIPDVNIDITTDSLPIASAATPLNLALTATGGKAPYVWEELTGNIPEGIDFHADGQLQGNAIAAGGEYQLVFKVTDADGAIHKQALKLVSNGYGLDESLYGWNTEYCFDTQSEPSLISGQVITALNGGSSDVTLNGITFTAYNLGGGSKSAYSGGVVSTGNTSYDNLLGSFSEGLANEETIVLNGLTPGADYSLQVFYNNKNSANGYNSQMHVWIDGRSVDVAIHSEHTSTTADDYGSYAVAQFIASGSSVELRLKAQSETFSIKGKAAFNALLLTKPSSITSHEGVSQYAEITWGNPAEVTGLQDVILGKPIHALNGGDTDISFEELGVVFQGSNIGYNNNQTDSSTNALWHPDFGSLMSEQTRTDYFHSVKFDGLTPGKEYQVQVFNKSRSSELYESIANGGFHSSDTYFGLYRQSPERIYSDGKIMQSVGTFTARSTTQVLEMHANEENPINHISYSAIYLVETPGQDDQIVDDGSNQAPSISELDGQVVSFLDPVFSSDSLLATFVGVDPDEGDSLTYSISSGNENGALRINPVTGELHVVDASLFTEVRNEIQVTVSDNKLPAKTASIEYIVVFSLGLPDGGDLSVSQQSIDVIDDFTNITLSAESLSGLPLTYQIVMSPIRGEIVGAAPNLSYQRTEAFTGQDGFTYTVSNGVTTSDEIVVILNSFSLLPQKVVFDADFDAAETVDPIGTANLDAGSAAGSWSDLPVSAESVGVFDSSGNKGFLVDRPLVDQRVRANFTTPVMVGVGAEVSFSYAIRRSIGNHNKDITVTGYDSEEGVSFEIILTAVSSGTDEMRVAYTDPVNGYTNIPVGGANDHNSLGATWDPTSLVDLKVILGENGYVVEHDGGNGEWTSATLPYLGSASWLQRIEFKLNGGSAAESSGLWLDNVLAKGRELEASSSLNIPNDNQQYLVISEIMYAPLPDVESEFIELYNTSDNLMLDLSGVQFTEGIDYTFPAGSELAPGGRIVVTKSEFSSGSLDDDGETVKLDNADGSAITEITYSSNAPWPSTAGEAGRSLVFISGEPNDPKNWRSSLEAGGTPGSSDSVPYTGGDLLSYAFTGELNYDSSDQTLSISKQPGADDVTFTLQRSNDLENWQDDEVEFLGHDPLEWEYQSTSDLQFFRLIIELTAPE